MKDDKAAEETTNLFADFKILATKFNDNNKIEKRNQKKQKNILEACKQEYQKLFSQRNTLKKNIVSWNKN